MFTVIVEDEQGKLVTQRPLRKGALTIGRTPENNIVLQSGAVSRQHARISLDATGVWISDLGSANGVLVDDETITEGTRITEVNRVTIGGYRVFLERESMSGKPSQNRIDTAIVHPEQAHGKLVISGGSFAGREHHLFDELVRVGRTDENDVTLADVSVSRHHARLSRQADGSYLLTDLNSSNGTMVGGRRAQTARAWHGDHIQFGNVECVLVDVHGKGRRIGGLPVWTLYVGGVVLAGVLGAVLSLLLL